jgi:peroxiredoxin (alkyl hydroperoxide reductase subunit C)
MSTLVGRPAPNFTAQAVMQDGKINSQFNLLDYFKGGYGVVFFWPLDFTFVCPSEILAYSHRAKALAERDTKIVGVSIDSVYTHNAWRNTPPENGGLGKVEFPMVADVTKSIARDYGVLLEAGIALRGTFLIDKGGKIRHALVNDLPLGRNADEIIRMVDALQFHEEHGEVCPAGWQKGDKGMKPTTEGVAAYLKELHASL